MTIELILSWPERILSPNARVHYMAYAQAKSRAKAEGYALTVRARDNWRTPAAGLVPVEIVFHPPTRRRFDRDNALASLKGQLDGIAEALGVDDSAFEPITLRRGEVIRGGCVRVRLGVTA